MDYTSSNRQHKFRERLKEDGKKQRTFYLSEKAMDAIRKLKEETQAPSVNHALENMLTNLATKAEAEEKIIQDSAQADKKNAIIEQAKRTAVAYRESEATYTNEARKAWNAESKMLAMLIDPSTPIKVKPLP